MQNVKPAEKFLLISTLDPRISDEDALPSLKEFVSLVESYGGVVEDILLQRRETHDKGMYIGTGKIEEAIQLIESKEIDVVVLNDILKPGHLYEMQTIFSKVNRQIQVWDRVDLILHIFSRNAQTTEARLQIELASMRHMGPRIYGMGMEMSRQGGGIGTRGVGETNTELMKQHWRTQMKKSQEKLKKLSKDRKRQIDRREEVGLHTVSVVGYTNAGKTSLFNRLVGKKKLVRNALFATLDSTVGKLYLPESKKEILISDTIGFIRDLPPELIDAFKSTLMESVYADILLHVIDISDPDMQAKIEVVESILKDLSLEDKKKIYVFNKLDLSTPGVEQEIKKNFKKFNPQFISVTTDKGIEELVKTLDLNFAL